MKRIYYLLTIVSLLFVGCSHEDSVFENPVISFNEFTATLDRPVTRLMIDEQGKLAWDATDVIGIYSDLTAQPVEFTYKGNNAFASTTEVRGTEFKAIYPYRANAVDATNKAIVHYTLPKDYMIDSYTLPMVAQSNSNQFSFKQTMGLLHFVLNDAANTKTISLKGNNNEVLAGSGYIDLSANEPVFVLDDNGGTAASSSVTINMPVSTSDTVKKEKLDIFFPVPIGSYLKGFNITIETSEGSTTKVSNDPVTVARASFDSYTEFSVFDEVKAANLAKEREALTALYNALDGPNWTYQDNWCSDKPVDQWYGIQTNDNGFVTKIVFQLNSLKGDLPADIGNLPYLEELILTDNSITSIPEEISKLHLVSLYLYGNELKSLPSSLAQIETLKELNLSSNLFEEIPEVIRGLKNLELLAFDDCKITVVPEWISELTNLETLFLSENELSGSLPECISALKNLHSLDLCYNQYEGNIPSSYFNELSNLEAIFIDGNNLSGTITVKQQQSPMWLSLSPTSKYINPQKDGYGIDIEGAVTSIQLNAKRVDMVIGDSFKLKVTSLLPDDAYNKNYYWKIIGNSDGNIKLDEDGTITALKEGNCTIYCIASDKNGAYTNCRIYIKNIKSDSDIEIFNGSDEDW